MDNKRIPSALVALILLLLLALPALAQETLHVVEEKHDISFRQKIVFTITVEGPSEISEATLLYRVAGQPVTGRGKGEFQPGRRVQASWEWSLSHDYIPPGTEIEYWWQIKDAAGGQLKTNQTTFTCEDDRFEWKELSSEKLRLYWYKGDDAFGKALFDKASEALDKLATDAGIEVKKQVKIFIYGSHEDLLGALAVDTQEWTGGQAFVDYGIVAIGVEPGELEWGKRATVHELTHLVVGQETKNPYGDLPHWLDEGLAMYAEGDLEPIYRTVLKKAADSDTLQSVQTLSSGFPADPNEAILAYAESYSLVDFITNKLGRDKMAKLLDIFAEGATYDGALTQALGMNTNGLEDAWRASIGARPRQGAVSQVATATPIARAATPPAQASEVSPPATTPPLPTPAVPARGVAPCLCGSLPGVALLVIFLALRPRGA
jgi:hypothetical protein